MENFQKRIRQLLIISGVNFIISLSASRIFHFNESSNIVSMILAAFVFIPVAAALFIYKNTLDSKSIKYFIAIFAFWIIIIAIIGPVLLILINLLLS